VWGKIHAFVRLPVLKINVLPYKRLSYHSPLGYKLYGLNDWCVRDGKKMLAEKVSVAAEPKDSFWEGPT
jgi:hypothetical protein